MAKAAFFVSFGVLCFFIGAFLSYPLTTSYAIFKNHSHAISVERVRGLVEAAEAEGLVKTSWQSRKAGWLNGLG